MDILESNAQIEKIVVKELQEHFRNCWIRTEAEITDGIRQRMISSIQAQPEYNSLLRGRLYAEFGLTDAPAKLAAILKEWSKNIESRYFKKTFKIQAITADFSNVLQLPEAQQITKKGTQLDWLNWLLIQGDTTIIREYEVVLGTTKFSNSRTGLAVMKRTKTGKWNVPSQYAGTVDANWVTRAIDDINDTDIENIVFNAIEKVW